MTDEQNQQSEQEIQEILSDLDAILSDLAATSPDFQLLTPPAAPAPAAETVVESAPPVVLPPREIKPEPIAVVLPPVEVKPDPVPAPVVSPPPAPKPQAVVEPPAPIVLPPLEITSSAGLTIELAPREGTIKAPEKKTAPAKSEVPVQLASQAKPPLEIKMESSPAPTVEPTPAPVPAAAAPAPAPAVTAEPSAPPAVIPEKTPKDQIRRIAVVYAPNFSKEKDEFIKFLDQCAQSFSKKPLFLRKVYVEIIQPGDNSRILLEKIKALGAVSLLGILDGLPDAKLKEISEVSAEGGLMFRSVTAADVKKKSIAVDIVVDMMLLGAEA